ncbi:MAG: cyclic-di-AMP receptor [Omnitrophica WOR_2 bacterium]
MKLIVAIIQDKDRETVTQALITSGYRVTRIASSGGFLRKGSTTLMIGLDEDMVGSAMQVIRENCSPAVEPGSKRASLFVLNVADFEQV